MSVKERLESIRLFHSETHLRYCNIFPAVKNANNPVILTEPSSAWKYFTFGIWTSAAAGANSVKFIFDITSWLLNQGIFWCTIWDNYFMSPLKYYLNNLQSNCLREIPTWITKISTWLLPPPSTSHIKGNIGLIWCPCLKRYNTQEQGKPNKLANYGSL